MTSGVVPKKGNKTPKGQPEAHVIKEKTLKMMETIHREVIALRQQVTDLQRDTKTQSEQSQKSRPLQYMTK
jgi:hypothetical protein